MPGDKRISSGEVRAVAVQRIRTLLEEAQRSFARYPERSNRYVSLARSIGMKARVRIPRELQRRYCKHCGHYLVPGANSRVRIREKRRVVQCLDCRHVMRLLLSEKRGPP